MQYENSVETKIRVKQHILVFEQLTNVTKPKKVNNKSRNVDTTIKHRVFLLVYSVFENVANSYDKMNDTMSLGIHRVWKDIFIRELAPTHGSKLLDAAGGTGDITFRYLKYLNSTKNIKGIGSSVVVCDINKNMLDVGKSRAEKQGWIKNDRFNIEWKQADAENLPFADDSFTAYTIAFGIRNVTHIDKVKQQEQLKQ